MRLQVRGLNIVLKPTSFRETGAFSDKLVLMCVIHWQHSKTNMNISLQDLTNLPRRGIFHCTTFWTFITAVLLTYSHLTKKTNVYTLTFMLILAFTSHHIRDGNRRGLWIYPYGHTSPINKYFYAILISILPNVFAYIFVFFKRDFKDNVEYTSIVWYLFLFSLGNSIIVFPRKGLLKHFFYFSVCTSTSMLKSDHKEPEISRLV